MNLNNIHVGSIYRIANFLGDYPEDFNGSYVKVVRVTDDWKYPIRVSTIGEGTRTYNNLPLRASELVPILSKTLEKKATRYLRTNLNCSNIV